jgi:hypothetical protein
MRVRLALAGLGQVEEEVDALLEHVVDPSPRLEFVRRARVRPCEHGQEDEVRERERRPDQVDRHSVHRAAQPVTRV